jgi:hypothetical protein
MVNHTYKDVTCQPRENDALVFFGGEITIFFN